MAKTFESSCRKQVCNSIYTQYMMSCFMKEEDGHLYVREWEAIFLFLN